MTKSIHGISTFSTDYLFCLLYYITGYAAFWLILCLFHMVQNQPHMTIAQDYGTNTLIYLQISIVLRAPPSFLLALLFLNQQSDYTNADKLWHHCKITQKWTTHKPFLVPSQKHQGTTNFLPVPCSLYLCRFKLDKAGWIISSVFHLSFWQYIQ